MSLYKKILLACTLAATLGQAHAEPNTTPAATATKKAAIKNSSNPISRGVTALLGIRAQDVTFKYLLLVGAITGMHHLTSMGNHEQSTEPYCLATKNLSIDKWATTKKNIITALLNLALLRLFYGQNPDLFSGSIMAFTIAQAYLPSKAMAAIPAIVLAQHAHSIRARKNITASLVDKKVIVFSRTIPEHMLDQEYCIIQSPWGYALKNLQPIATEIKNFFQKIQDQTAHSTGKAAAVFKYTETTYKKAALPLMSCAKIFPWFPHAYILKSDLDELPLQQQKVIHHLMSEDTTNTLLLLPGTISRELNALKYARWLKALRKKPGQRIEV